MVRVQANTEARELRERIRAEALAVGFSRAGFAGAEPLGPTIERRRTEWLAEGRAGAMQYLHREHPRRTHPRDLLPEARTALVVLAGYYDGDHPPAAPDEGRIARYAWGEDYHGVMRRRLDALAERIQRIAQGAGIAAPLRMRPCVDSAPIDERALAARAGLGFIGKNTLLIDPAGGSWTLIGVLLISLDLPPDEPLRGPAASCAGCRRCLDACPTGAIDRPYRLDARRCLSYLTIEQKNEIPLELAARMEGWAFGCDICQEVCPFNDRPLGRLLPELAADRGAGPLATPAMLERDPSARAFRRRWGHTPLERPGRKGLERNLRALAAGRRPVPAGAIRPIQEDPS
ncbi:MAG: Epoxyqueuosine reductase [candidate division BRC1 bacterium ADurb.BinA292]|nr:MAG: Epoxyqueuosine reductase [candidate division BRC1 bacterium ADurb.BinA292]